MTVSLSRALGPAGVPRFASVTYIGDAVLDATAAAAHGLNFIGIDTSRFVRDAAYRLPDDFSDCDRLDFPKKPVI